MKDLFALVLDKEQMLALAGNLVLALDHPKNTPGVACVAKQILAGCLGVAVDANILDPALAKMFEDAVQQACASIENEEIPGVSRSEYVVLGGKVEER